MTPDEFFLAATTHGFLVTLARNTITLSSTFEIGDDQTMRRLHRVASNMFDEVPIGRPTHREGTDPGSITGSGALRNGYYHLTLTGATNGFVAALNEIVNNADPRTMDTNAETTSTWDIQISKGKGRYRSVQTLRSERQAYWFYGGYNIHSGYNIRLVNPDGKIVERYRSAA